MYSTLLTQTSLTPTVSLLIKGDGCYKVFFQPND